jgi:beta-lactamase class A
MRPTFAKLWILVAIALAFGTGVALARALNPRPSATADPSPRYPLLAKRIFLDNPNDTLINFVPLRKALEQKFSTVTAPYSFYFEYLPTGTAIRIGGDQELVGASLLKLPAVMDLYHAGEQGKVKLDEQQTLSADVIDNQYGDLWKKGPGYKLTLRQAAKIALAQSDNTAILTIQKRTKGLLTPDDTTLSAVDADYSLQNNQALINAKSYSSILKCLYFSCYLNPADSQEVLTYLTQSDFNSRIARPVPDNVPVAHKIGVQDTSLSESDCGIIYLPRRQYSLCIMVGLPTDQADQLMADVSSIVYQAVKQHD